MTTQPAYFLIPAATFFFGMVGTFQLYDMKPSKKEESTDDKFWNLLVVLFYITKCILLFWITIITTIKPFIQEKETIQITQKK